MSTKKFWDWVNEEREARGLSFRAIERAGEVSNGAISKRESENAPPTAATCLAIAKAFNIPVENVFERAGFLPKASGKTSTNQEIDHLLSLLTAEEQKMVLEMIRGLYQRRARQTTTANAGKATSKA